MFKFVLLAALSIGIIQYASGTCNACQDNGVACVSEKEFQLCFEGVPDSSKTYSCLGATEVCTKYGRFCMDTNLSSAKPACGDNANCGQCEAGDENDGVFACTSRTTFTMCFGGELSDIKGSCPERQVCDIGLGKQKEYPCVPSCKEKEGIEMCDLIDAIDVPPTTTSAPTTTTTEVTTTTEEVTPTETTTTTIAPTESTTTTEIPTTTTKTLTTTTQISTTTTTEMPTTTTTELPTTTTQIPTTTTEKPTTTPPITTTEEITTTTIFSPTPSPLPTTTTTEPATTTTELPTTTQNPAELVCSQQAAVGRYPYPNDTTCTNYIYCYRKGGLMQSTYLKCPPQSYFNPSTSLCGKDKPAGCI